MLQKVYNVNKKVNFSTPHFFKLICSVEIISVGGKNE